MSTIFMVTKQYSLLLYSELISIKLVIWGRPAFQFFPMWYYVLFRQEWAKCVSREKRRGMNLDVFNHHLRYICSILDFDIAELWVAEPCGGPMDGVNRLVFTHPPNHSLMYSFHYLLVHFTVGYIISWFYPPLLQKLIHSRTSDSSSKSAIKTKFIQLYTSPTYNDYYSLLIKPHSTYGNEEENSSENKRSDDEEIHIFSPIICRGNWCIHTMLFRSLTRPLF